MPEEGYARLLGLAPEHLGDDLCRTPTTTIIRLAELTTVHAPWTEMALALARRSRIGALGVWDYLVTSALTPLEGIQDAATYFGTVGDTSTDALHVSENGHQVVISHLNQADMAYEAGSAVSAYALGGCLQRLSDAAQRQLVPLRVTLASETPRRHHSLIDLFGTRAIDFEAPVSSMTFLASDLKSPNPQAQPGLSAVLRKHAEQTLASSVALHDWLDLFRAALVSVHDEGAATLAAAARRLAVSPRTLQRRLNEHGTTWHDELEALRQGHITRLLHRTDLTIDAVAAEGGYGDASALRRAVKRWYGTTPGSLRRSGDPTHGSGPVSSSHRS
ncbi:helix-turn-helix domain-containing protein [Streptomyces virginiae]|uniref:AraC family transcriptional regulator n=1 Tax=Streptomyces virginiae TaxID=1961 RepID=UPI00362F356C